MRRLIPAVFLFVAALIVACGGGNGTDREEFISDADAICAESIEKLDQLDDQYNALAEQGTQEGYRQASDALDQQIPLYEQTISELEALTPPEGDEATFQRFVDSLREEQRLTMDLSVAVIEPSVEAYDAVLDQYNRAHIRSEGLAQGYGFNSCGD